MHPIQRYTIQVTIRNTYMVRTVWCILWALVHGKLTHIIHGYVPSMGWSNDCHSACESAFWQLILIEAIVKIKKVVIAQDIMTSKRILEWNFRILQGIHWCFRNPVQRSVSIDWSLLLYHIPWTLRIIKTGIYLALTRLRYINVKNDSDITRVSWCLKLTAMWLFVYKFVLSNKKGQYSA